ncbi:MAG: PAS domain S-box protein [Candidatus Aminicenantes bacterium]
MNEIRTKLLKDLDNVRRKITEMEEAEADRSRESEKLQSEKEHLRKLLERAPVGIVSIDVQGRVRFINQEMKKKFETSGEENLHGRLIWELEPFIASGLASDIRKTLENQKPAASEAAFEGRKGDKKHIHSRMSPLFNKDGSISGVMVVTDEISQPKESDSEIARCLCRLIGDFDFDSAMRETLAEMGQRSEADQAALFLLYDENTKMDNTHEWLREGEKSGMEKLQNLSLSSFPWLLRQLKAPEPVAVKDVAALPPEAEKEKEFWTSRQIQSVLLIPVPVDDHSAGVIMLEKHRAPGEWGEEKMAFFKLIADSTGKALRVKKEEERSRERQRRFSRFARAGFEALIVLQENQIIDANQAAGAIFGYKPSEYLGQDLFFFIHPSLKQETEEYLESAPSRPMEAKGIKKSGEEFPVEILTRRLEENGRYLQVVAVRDVSGRKLESGDLRDRYDSLHQMSHDLLKILARTVELRDGNSRGHMQRVTALALFIAEEMQLPKDKGEALETAAAIHDIGKIGVPVEILNKTEKLSKAEKLVVQNHPEIGYDLLKDVSFPWPVAEIILQHHEYMDGSGYPRGLSGDGIIMEARILRVADTVEKFLSSRLHKPPHKKDSLLQELTGEKGRLYDPEVVEACLKVLADKNFSFDSL